MQTSAFSLEAALIPNMFFTEMYLHQRKQLSIKCFVYQHLLSSRLLDYSHLTWGCYIFCSFQIFLIYQVLSLNLSGAEAGQCHSRHSWDYFVKHSKCCRTTVLWKMLLLRNACVDISDFLHVRGDSHPSQSCKQAHLESTLFRSLFCEMTNTPYRMTGSAVNVCIVDTYYQTK